MFTGEQLDLMANKAKQKLQEQVAEQEQHNDYEDLYAEFRDELEYKAVPSTEAVVNSDISLERHRGEYEELGELQVFDGQEEAEAYVLDPYDQPIFEGGPSQSQVDLWKKEWTNHNIFAVNVLDEYFVARTLNRFEYKQLVGLENINALQREEVICNTCVLWPSNYDYKAMAIAKGGIPSSLSQVIMENSGFTQDYQIQIL